MGTKCDTWTSACFTKNGAVIWTVHLDIDAFVVDGFRADTYVAILAEAGSGSRVWKHGYLFAYETNKDRCINAVMEFAKELGSNLNILEVKVKE